METTRPQVAHEDFSSIVLTLDHLAATDLPDGHRAHKFVASTQSLNESMIGLFAYYGLSALLQQPDTIEMFQQAGQPIGLPVFILHTEQNTQVVTDVDTWAVLIARFGRSVLSATEALEDMVGSHLALQKEARGAVPTLSLFMFSAQDTDQPMQDARPVEAESRREGPRQAAKPRKTRQKANA